MGYRIFGGVTNFLMVPTLSSRFPIVIMTVKTQMVRVNEGLTNIRQIPRDRNIVPYVIAGLEETLHGGKFLDTIEVSDSDEYLRGDITL